MVNKADEIDYPLAYQIASKIKEVDNMTQQILRPHLTEDQVIKKFTKIKEILDELASNPDDYDTYKIAVEIYELNHQGELCPVCGADKNVWLEIFGEEHYCKPEWKR